MTMMKAFVLTVALAACGSKSKPADTATVPPATTETAKEVPAEKPAEPTGPSEAELAVAQAELAAQYEDGKKVYVAKKCDTCHGKNGEGNPKNPALIGLDKALPEQPAATSKMRKGVSFKTAKDVMDFVKAKMPPKTPNLTEEEAASVTSWILSESKVNITKKLDASNAASVNLR